MMMLVSLSRPSAVAARSRRLSMAIERCDCSGQNAVGRIPARATKAMASDQTTFYTHWT